MLAVAPITTVLNYAITHRADLIIMRSDLEVYTGFYLIIGWFFSMSTLVSILLYWQVARVRAMLNPQTKLAFVRFDDNLNTYVISRLPAIARKPYDFIKAFMVSMGSPPVPASEQF